MMTLFRDCTYLTITLYCNLLPVTYKCSNYKRAQRSNEWLLKDPNYRAALEIINLAADLS